MFLLHIKDCFCLSCMHIVNQISKNNNSKVNKHWFCSFTVLRYHLKLTILENFKTLMKSVEHTKTYFTSSKFFSGNILFHGFKFDYCDEMRCYSIEILVLLCSSRMKWPLFYSSYLYFIQNWYAEGTTSAKSFNAHYYMLVSNSVNERKSLNIVIKHVLFAVTPIFILLLYKRSITETTLQRLMLMGWQRWLPNVWNYSNKRIRQ